MRLIKPLFSLAIGWALAAGAAAQMAPLAPRPAEQGRYVRNLQTDQPVPRAHVVLMKTYRPLLGQMFSSADPTTCHTITFARADDAGRLPAGVQGFAYFVLTDEALTSVEHLEVTPDAAAFALVQYRPLEVRRDQYVQFGPVYSGVDQAVAAMQAFHAAPENRTYSAMWDTAPPHTKDSGFATYRSAVPTRAEVARSAARYASAEQAKEALLNTAWVLPGAPKLEELRELLVRCYDRPVRGAEHAGPLLDAMERSTAAAHRTPDALKLVQHWRERVKR